MIYKNLSIAAGGGIISHSQQAEQEECANIFIGLGGTGISCLREVKKQVYNRLSPDDPKAEIPEYNHIQFLAIDTDKSSLGDDNSISTLDSATDYVDISCSDIHSILGNTRVLRQDPSLKWFSDDISILAAEAGAGGVRQVGRLLLIQNIEKIISAMKKKITLAITNLRNKPVNVHIFTGMGGGTGSGTFLDICYILQKVLKDMSLLGNAYTCGYFFLPDVNLAKVEVESVKEYIQINGFAAMKELDYCMNFENNGGTWDQNYGSFEIHSNQPPVKLAHLITAKDESGSVIQHGYEYCMNVVVDYVMEFMTKQIVDDKDRDAGNFGLKSHIANFNKIVEMIDKKRGARYYYCVLGASNAYIPYKEINSYLASRIFEAYENLPRACHDIDTFCKNNRMTYKDLLGEINKNVGAIPMFEVDANELYNQVQGIMQPNVFPQLVSHMLGKKPEIEGNYAKNRESLIQNMIVSLKSKLEEYCGDATRGPIYASLLLKNFNKDDRDMFAVIEGYIKENEKNVSQALATLELREQELATALRELQNSKAVLGGRGKKAKSYVGSVYAYFTQQLKVKLYYEMGEFLNTFKPQVTSLYNSFFAPLIDTLNNVAETFRANFVALDESVRNLDDYSIKIIGLDDESLKESLDAAVDKLDTTAIVLHFVEFLIKNPKKWESKNNETQISAMVSEYFVEQLKDFTNKNIDEYLITRFKTNTQEELVDAVYKKLMLKLETMAAPMFWARSAIDEKSKMGYCSVPSTSNAIKAAVDKLHSVDPKIDGRSSIMPDRISMLIFYCGVPMFMFKGIDLYYPDYSSREGMVGKHLYEGTAYDERNFHDFSNLIPLSLMSHEDITDKIQQFIDDYAQAVDFGIIEKRAKGVDGRQYDYFLRKIDMNDYEEKTRKMKKHLDEWNPDRAKKYIENEENNRLEFGEEISLPNTGTEGYKDDVVKDHVFASMKLTQEMYEQLEVYRQFKAILQKVIDKLSSGSDFENSVKTFTEAMCTGIIYPSEDDKYVFNYIKGDDDFPDEYKLTDMDTAPYGDAIPLYSAFDQYVKLDKEDKAEIAQKAKNKQRKDEEECIEITKKIKTYLEKRADLIRDVANERFKSDRKVINDFVVLMTKNIKTFERTLLM